MIKIGVAKPRYAKNDNLEVNENLLTKSCKNVILKHSGSSTFLQRGSPPPPPWRLLPELFSFDWTLTERGRFTRFATPFGGVAQLVRALPCHGRGYGFEPRRSRHHLLAILQMT